MSKKVHFFLCLFLLALSFPLFSHRSSIAVVFGRYSFKYAVLLFLYLLFFGCALILFFFHNRTMRFIRNIVRRPPDFSISAFAEKHRRALLILIFAWYVTGIFAVFRPSVIFSRTPVLDGDYSYHYHQTASMVHSMNTSGHHWSYDPSFCAGYPEGTINDVDVKFIEMFSYGMNRLGLNLALSYNLSIFLCLLAIPFVLYFSARNFGCSPAGAFLILLTGVLLYLSNSTIQLFTSAGMCMFVFCSYWTVFCASLLFRYCKRQTFLRWFVFSLALSMALMIHILMPLLLLIPLGTIYWLSFHRMSRLSHGALWLAAVLALFINMWWIRSVLMFMHYRVTTPFFRTFNAREFLRMLSDMVSIQDFLAVLGILGFYAILRSNKKLSWMGILSMTFLFLLAKLGSEIPLIRSFEPGRFTIPLNIFAMIGVSLWLGQEFKHFWRLHSSWRMITGIALVFVLIHFSVPQWIKMNGSKDERDSFQPLVTWINQNTDNSARIAVPDLGGGFFTRARLRFYCERQFIGGPFYHLNMLHNFANFTNTRFFNLPVSTIDESSFLRYCELYNIRWVISPEVLGWTELPFLENNPENFLFRAEFTQNAPQRSEAADWEKELMIKADPGVQQKTVRVYEVKRTSNYFLRGSGEIEAEPNRLKVSGASSGEVVIKYHWLETLAVSPSLPIKKFQAGDDPVGFIKISNGNVKEFEIYNSFKKH